MRRGLFALILLLAWLPARLSAQQQTRTLNTTTFVVLGEGLAAGMANFGLHEVVQRKSFPALMAQQMNTAFPQPLLEGPGITDVLGYPSLPVRVPTLPQGRVRVYPKQPGVDVNDETPTLFVFNLSVPNLGVAESLNLRPVSPLIHTDDSKQTAINLILGFPSMILNENVSFWSQLEYAKAMVPSFALIELGYYDVLAAVVSGEPGKIPDRAAFRSPYLQIVQELRGMGVEVVVTTIPYPMDTAYFSNPASIARLTRVPESLIRDFYGLAAGDYVTRNGLTVIGNQFIRRNIQPLPSNIILRASSGVDISNRVQALNDEIKAIANEQGAVVYDLAAFLRGIKTAGVTVGSTPITSNYFGGFYSLDGYYPGPTGHALIANDILKFLNSTYGQNFPMVDVAPILQDDAVPLFRTAREPDEQLYQVQPVPRRSSE
ncbi:MAG: hypothetical protein HYX73_05990 [Acidobacteria bacterium]|nr:hypothetical protein [Acidobacteriota bacterium]